jgi:cytochrome P450
MTQLDEEMRKIITRKRTADTDEGDVLSMLLQARDAESGVGLSEDELLGHVSVIFAAGHETSANALTWTLFLLSQHPEVAADLLDELESVLQGEAPSIEQLQQLPLLERVIKESMRVLPPVPWNGRVTSKPTELGGYALPQGTEVFVSIYQTHHMPELYPNPEAFNPQRWETIEPTPYEYNPFSAGQRLCIGAAFAMMEIKIVLAMLLQRYRLQLLPQLRIDRFGLIIMAPKYGMPMVVHQQDRQFALGVGGVRGNVREMVNLSEY